jgi:hypothetical protein
MTPERAITIGILVLLFLIVLFVLLDIGNV